MKPEQARYAAALIAIDRCALLLGSHDLPGLLLDLEQGRVVGCADDERAIRAALPLWRRAREARDAAPERAREQAK